jgi:hypothetical protein
VTAGRRSRIAGAASELAEPAQPLVPRNCRIRRRCRRQYEQPLVAERPLLHAELGTLAERTAIRLLADEPDPARVDAGQSLGRAGEVVATQVAGARRRARRGVRDADARLQELELLSRLIETRGEARRMQQPPEIVARVGEVRVRRR